MRLILIFCIIFSLNSFASNNKFFFNSNNFNKKGFEYNLISNKLDSIENKIYQPKFLNQTFSSFGLGMGFGAGTFFTSFFASEFLYFKGEDFGLISSAISLPFTITAHTYGAAYGCFLPVKNQKIEFKYAMKGALIGLGGSFLFASSLGIIASLTNFNEVLYALPVIYILPSVISASYLNKKYKNKTIIY